MATSLYAQQRLSLPDVDAIGYDVDGSWIDLYKKVGTDRYAQRRLQIDRKKIRISKASAAYQMVWDLYSCNDTLSRNDIEKARERFVDVDNLRPIALENYVGKTFDIKEGGKWKRNEENSSYVLKFLRPDLAFAQLLRYAKADRYAYSVITTSSCVPDSVTTWRGMSQPLNPLVLEMKGGKTVLLFAYRSFDYLLLPTIKSDQFVKLSRECQPAELTAAGNKYDAAAPARARLRGRGADSGRQPRSGAVEPPDVCAPRRGGASGAGRACEPAAGRRQHETAGRLAHPD
ncbi:MAG: hypothetical protein ACFNOJ_01590, partial [Prevotella nigrescens]